MTTYYANNVNVLNTVPSTLVDANALGVEKRWFDSWSALASGISNNDLVQVGTVPAGARLASDSYIDFGAFGTSGAVKVGTADNDDEFAASADVSSAARVTLSANQDYVASADTPVYVKITNKGNASTLAINGVNLKFIY